MAWWGRSVRMVGSGWSESGGSEYAAPELENMVRREASAAAQPSFYAYPGMWSYAWDRRRATKTNCTALCNPWTCPLHPVAVSEECPICYSTDRRSLPCHVCVQPVCAACRIRHLHPDTGPSCPFCRSPVPPSLLRSLAQTALRHPEFQLDGEIRDLLSQFLRSREGADVWGHRELAWDDDDGMEDSLVDARRRLGRPPRVLPSDGTVTWSYASSPLIVDPPLLYAPAQPVQEFSDPAETSASQDTISTAVLGGWASSM